VKNLKAKVCFLLIFFGSVVISQNESHYINLLVNQLNGVKEQRVQNGRVDIVTATHAIEVEWASNWKHSIGQALWYGLQTNKEPGIILLMKSIDDRKYGIMLQSALDYAGISEKIKVWFYPEDFDETFESVETNRQEHKQNLLQTNGQYTCNKNSGVRHNSKCTYFDCANCVPCGPTDGKKACGKCGG
jgi:hypothetical protein